MKTLKNTQEKVAKTKTRIFQALLIVAVCFIASDVYSQTKEVEFDVYTTSASKASRYLLADDVALRDCPSVQCEQLTTITIGTNVRLLAKSDKPHTINGIKSRWYKIKMGPQVGWIWGGMISQKTIASTTNPEIKFVFGEAGFDFKGHKLFQVRAVKNGAQIDKMVFRSERLNYEEVTLMQSKALQSNGDIIRLDNLSTNGSYVVFKNNKLKKTTTLVAKQESKPIHTGYSYVLCSEDEN